MPPAKTETEIETSLSVPAHDVEALEIPARLTIDTNDIDENSPLWRAIVDHVDRWRERTAPFKPLADAAFTYSDGRPIRVACIRHREHDELTWCGRLPLDEEFVYASLAAAHDRPDRITLCASEGVRLHPLTVLMESGTIEVDPELPSTCSVCSAEATIDEDNLGVDLAGYVLSLEHELEEMEREGVRDEMLRRAPRARLRDIRPPQYADLKPGEQRAIDIAIGIVDCKG